MTRRPPELEAMLEELVKRKDIPSNAAAEIEEAVLTSISLRERMVEAATASRPLLKHIGVAPPGSNTGGYYDSESRTLFVAAEAFDEQKRGGVHRRVDYVTGVMGHEVAHALLDKERQQATNALRYGIRQALEKGGDQATLDLTELTDHYLKFSRWDESVSEIGGINAVSSRVTESANGEIDQGEILKRAQISSGCVIKQGRGLALAPDISMGSDGKIAITNQDQHGLKTQTGNIEAVAQCHFDGGQKSLGKGGATNYQNYYGAAALEIIANEVEYNRQRQQGVTPEIKLDLASLQLDAGQMQAAGINLDLGKVQGREVRAFTLLDTSQGAPQQVMFRHSRTPGKADQHPDEQAQETAPRQAALTPRRPRTCGQCAIPAPAGTRSDRLRERRGQRGYAGRNAHGGGAAARDQARQQHGQARGCGGAGQGDR